MTGRSVSSSSMRSYKFITFFLIYWIGLVSAVPSSRLTGPCNCVCGVRGRTNRIVGGTRLQPHDQPWLAVLRRQGKFYCGATVISQNFVITAAHCVYGFDINGIRVYFGGHEVSKDYTDIRKIKNIYDHEDYDVVSFNNDIAILELDRPIEFGPKVQPACLPNGDISDYSGSLTLIAGWGKTQENGKESNVVNSVILPIWTKEQCEDAGYGKKRITNNMMCAGYHDGGKDACQGDSGGPMLIEGPTGSVDIIGVVSWGRGCARPNLPGIYTKLTNYLPWIHNKISGECLCHPKHGERSNFIESLAQDF